MRVLVTDATNGLGPRMVEVLLDAGYTVRVLVRQPPLVGLFPPIVELWLGDITQPASLLQAMEGCAGVIHWVALSHMTNSSSALHMEYDQISVIGTANVVQAAQSLGVQRLVFFSTIAVYGHGGAEPFTEATPPQPDSIEGETMLAAEKLVLAAQRTDGEPLGVVLRLAEVYGAHIKDYYQRLLTTLACKRFLLLGKGGNRRTLVYDRDVAAAALLALQHSSAAGGVYNVTDGDVYTLREIIYTICAAFHWHPPRLYTLFMPVRPLIGLLENLRDRLGHASPTDRATLDKYLEEMIVDGSYIQQTLGFAPYYSLTAGWKDLVEERLALYTHL